MPCASLLVVFGAVLSASVQDPRPKTQAPPVFRAGIELATIDVTALDGNGRQVMALAAGESQVEIDGGTPEHRDRCSRWSLRGSSTCSS